MVTDRSSPIDGRVTSLPHLEASEQVADVARADVNGEAGELAVKAAAGETGLIAPPGQVGDDVHAVGGAGQSGQVRGQRVVCVRLGTRWIGAARGLMHGGDGSAERLE